jgi:hypothetical protein
VASVIPLQQIPVQKSVVSRHTSIFDQPADSQVTLNKNRLLENNHRIEEKLKKLGKILNKHQRIESVINHIDPIDINSNRRIVYDELVHVSAQKVKVTNK